MQVQLTRSLVININTDQSTNYHNSDLVATHLFGIPTHRTWLYTSVMARGATHENTADKYLTELVIIQAGDYKLLI